MQEDFLHYVWQYKQFNCLHLKTTANEPVIIKHLGQLNSNSGPDFFNAQLVINKQHWAGNIEVHIKSSDWYIHNHETDKAYDSVILHVVWEHDVDVFRKNNTPIPTLEIKSVIHTEALSAYQKLFNNKTSWVNCENDICNIDRFLVDHWLEKLYIERLEQKSLVIQNLLEKTNNNWEELFFIMICKNFGLKINGDSFFQLANEIPFSLVRKNQNSIELLEALFFGQANLLPDDSQEAYVLNLKKNYLFLKQKYQLQQKTVQMHFFRLRPQNFPTIRLSQLAVLYHANGSLFSKLMEAETVKAIYSILQVQASTFWTTHYSFLESKTNQLKPTKKQITKAFIDLIIINTILPVKFAYLKSKGQHGFEELCNILRHLKPEENTIIKKFSDIGLFSKTALDSQAILQLKNEYCIKNKCLQCAIGNKILQQK